MYDKKFINIIAANIFTQYTHFHKLTSVACYHLHIYTFSIYGRELHRYMRFGKQHRDEASNKYETLTLTSSSQLEALFSTFTDDYWLRVITIKRLQIQFCSTFFKELPSFVQIDLRIGRVCKLYNLALKQKIPKMLQFSR